MESQREASPFLCNEPLFLEENIKGEFKRGEAPLLKKLFLLMIGICIHIMESQREAKPLLNNQIPFPLRGRG